MSQHWSSAYFPGQEVSEEDDTGGMEVGRIYAAGDDEKEEENWDDL